MADQQTDVLPQPTPPKQTDRRRLAYLFCLLIAFALRVYTLDAKGLSYDEAATALMARATPAEIVAFHWRAAFEHPPLWQLLMHSWSSWVGQTEFALRYLSVLAGTILLPLLLQLARRWPIIAVVPATPLLTLALAVVAPILIYYSQEARMYALVVTCAVTALWAVWRLLTQLTDPTTARPSVTATVLLLLGLHWAMLGLHYYSVLLVAAEGVFCLLWLVITRARGQAWWIVLGTLTLAVAPLALWLALAPGFHDTLRMVLADTTPQPAPTVFLNAFWRELSFAAVRWEVAQSVWGYLWLPLLAAGALVSILPQQAVQRHARVRAWLPLLAVVLPLSLSAFAFPTLATRYLLYVTPGLLLLLSAGIGWLGRWHWGVGGGALLAALVVPAMALPHYYGPYQKSEYQQMAAYLTAHRQADEAVLLEAPRQHLLAKYYLPADLPLYSAPAVTLPPYWPVNAPPVVPEEMDDQLQALLREYRGVWLSLTAENEVDPGEFVPKYLTAVAFEQACHGWLDVRLCYYRSPYHATPDITTRINARFGNDLDLTHADLAQLESTQGRYLLATLHWRAQATPQIDYRVTLRLLDTSGAVRSQRDALPIGPLLPPTTWQPGDEKPGYLALPLPTDLAAGRYTITVNLYHPADGAPTPHTMPATRLTFSSDPIVLANLVIDDTITISEP
jgi:hypothetical protein